MWNNSSYSFKYEEREGARAWFTASVAMCWVFATLVPALNIAVIVTILKYRKPSRLYFLLLNMAVADLLTGVFDAVVRAIELTAGYQILFMPWSAGTQACKLQRSLSNAFAMASNFLLAITSLDRAIVIAKPMIHFKRGFIMQKVFTAACWIISLCCNIPVYISFHTKQIQGTHIVVCHHDNAVFPFAVLIHMLFGALFVVPLLVVVCSYLLLITSLIRRTEGSIRVKGSLSEQDPRLFRVFNRNLPRSKVRSVQLMCGIVSGFLIAWIPFFTVVYMGIYASFSHPSITFLLLSYYLNPVVNPTAFFLFHRLRLQRSQPSVDSGTLLRSSWESRHVRPSTMREEMKLNDDKSAISDHCAEEETVFCNTGKILITNANNESTVIEENGIEDKKMNI